MFKSIFKFLGKVFLGIITLLGLPVIFNAQNFPKDFISLIKVLKKSVVFILLSILAFMLGYNKIIPKFISSFLIGNFLLIADYNVFSNT